MTDRISGFDVTLREWLTPVAMLAVLGLATVAITQALGGEKIGSFGALLILVVAASVGAKFAAEAYLLSYLGTDDSPRERAADRMVSHHSGLMKLRFTLSALGGVVLPLGVQILSAGLKDVRPVSDPLVPAVIACLAAALLIPGEYAERKLWHLSVH